jgi:membrane protease subunit HflC
MSMRKHIGILVLGVVVLLLLLVYTVAFQVSQSTDLFVVTTFGKTTEVYSGRDANQSGLHFKILYPVQQAVRFDARTFLFEDTLDETSTKDKKSVMGSIFCAWRIEDANQFLAAVATAEAAEDRIRQVVRSAKNRAFSQWDLAELINTDPRRMKLRDVEDRITQEVGPGLRQAYGVGIVMVGIKRLGLSESVSEIAIETMKQERQTMAQDYRSSGEARATAIRERARSAADKILAFATRKAEAIRTEGYEAAAEYWAKFQGHEDLAIFLQNIEMMRKTLANRTVFLLDESSMPFLKLFRQAPTAEAIRQMTATAPAPIRGERGEGRGETGTRTTEAPR